MIDASYIKVHPYAAGAIGVDAFGMPLRLQITFVVCTSGFASFDDTP